MLQNHIKYKSFPNLKTVVLRTLDRASTVKNVIGGVWASVFMKCFSAKPRFMPNHLWKRTAKSWVIANVSIFPKTTMKFPIMPKISSKGLIIKILLWFIIIFILYIKYIIIKYNYYMYLYNYIKSQSPIFSKWCL